MPSHHACQPSALFRDGLMPAPMHWSLTSANLARIRFEMVLRLGLNRPVLDFPQICVKPKKSNVSGFFAIPSLFKVVKGWHARPGKETVTIGLRQQADQSPSGTGRAHIWCPTAPTDRHLHVLDATNQSDRTDGQLTVATVTRPVVDHNHSAPQYSLACPRSSTRAVGARHRSTVLPTGQ